MNQIILMGSEDLENLIKDVREMKLMVLQGRLNNDLPELLRTSEVKKLLKLKDSSLATLRQNGTLPFTKVGGTIYFLKKDIIKSITNNYSGTDETLY